MCRRLYLVTVGPLMLALLSVVVLAQANTAISQGTRVTIAGSVVNAVQSPLTGVVVTLEQNGQITHTTTTDAQGNFRFTEVAAGTYQLRARSQGFLPFSQNVNVPEYARSTPVP